MTEAPPPQIAVIWSPEARSDLRAIDRETAMQILYCIARYLASRTGDVKRLKPPLTGFRFRCADYRVFFDSKEIVESPSLRSFIAARPTAERPSRTMFVSEASDIL